MFKPADITSWIEGCGGTRFLLTLGAGVVNTGLVIAQVIDPTTYRDLILGTVGAYIVGATYEKVREYASQ